MRVRGFVGVLRPERRYQMRCPLEKVLVGIVWSFHSRETWGGWQTMSRILGLAGLGARSEGFGRQGGD